MTLISLQNGSVVFTNGSVGTGSECCCKCCTLQWGPVAEACCPDPPPPAPNNCQESCDADFEQFDAVRNLFEQAGWSTTLEEYVPDGCVCGWILTMTCSACIAALPLAFSPDEPPDPENWLEVPFVNGLPAAGGTLALYCNGEISDTAVIELEYAYNSGTFDQNGYVIGSTYIPLCGNPLP